MTHSAVDLIIEGYSKTHERILGLVERLSDEQVRWQGSAGSPSIAFYVWHVARWADHLQAAAPRMTPELGRRLGPAVQIWEAEGLAARWGFDAEQLGYAATGMEMDESIAARLPFPARELLLDYLRRTFAAAERAVRAIDEAQFAEVEQPQSLTEGVRSESTVGDALIVHLMHDNRHLGMMECLAGLQSGSGTATV